MILSISKAYPHGGRWRCRLKTPAGWRWAPSADTPEEATAAAQAAPDGGAGGPASSGDSGSTAPPEAAPEAAPDATPEAAPAPQGSTAAGGVRIEGPYAHRGRWRCRIASSSGRSWCPAGKSPAHAIKIAEAQAEEEARQGVRSVRECIEVYLQDMRGRGIRPRSLDTFRGMLHRFFRPVLDEALARVTPHRAAALYEQLRTSLGERTGKPLAVDTHKNALTTARTFLEWCADRHWLKDNPLARVRGVGHKRKGKPTLLVDSSRIFLQVALREAAAGDDGALAAVIGIALGLRAGEVVSRLVRDVDAGGTVLQVQDTPEYGWLLKTSQSKRALGLPPYLQPLLRQRVAGKKDPQDLLFPSAVGKLQWPSWCNRQVARLCKLAGVPRVCMHSLRGTAATNSILAGASPEAAARQLGHKNSGTISGAYVPAHVIDHAARERGMEALLAGVTLPSEPTAPPSPA